MKKSMVEVLALCLIPLAGFSFRCSTAAGSGGFDEA